MAEAVFKIHEWFTETVQGEGFWVGCPADFIRLWGCPVGCWFCDTGYSDRDRNGSTIPYKLVSTSSLVERMRSPMVVITGGEPMISKNLPELVGSLIQGGRRVSIETSGSSYQDVGKDAWITLSPKQHISERFPVLAAAWDRADEVKIVVSDGSEVEHYREHLSKKSCPIYLQPEYSKLEVTIPKTLDLLSQYPTARLSMQIHKWIGVR